MERSGGFPNIAANESESTSEVGESVSVEKKRSLGAKFFRLFEREGGDSESEHQKKIEKIAKKKNYSKNKDGKWVIARERTYIERTEDGRQVDVKRMTETPVPGFELDEKYPDVAARYEGAIEKYFGKYRDKRGRDDLRGRMYESLMGNRSGGYKESIVESIENFSSLSTDAWEDAAYLSCTTLNFGEMHRLMRAGKEDKESLLKYAETLPKKRRTIDRILGKVESREKFLDDENNLLMLEWISAFHSDECEKEDFIDTVKAIGDGEYKGTIFGRDVTYCVEGVLKYGGSEFLKDYLGKLSWVKEQEKNGNISSNLRNGIVEIMSMYVRDNGLEEKSLTAFTRIIEGLEEKDKDLKGFGDDIARSENGTYGVDMYVAKCYAEVNEPENIDLLVRIHNEIPTSDFGKREQNRKDAITLQGRFFRDRGFIHEEKPGVHEIISAIVGYYDGKDNPEGAEERKEALKSVIQEYDYGIAYEDSMETYFDFSKYEEPVGDEKIIDILRRLKENTEPVPLAAPETKYPEVNEALGKIDPILNEKTGEVKVGIGEVGEAVAALNKVLLEGRGEQNLFPSTISVVAYLDKMAAYALRGVDKKEWSELVFDDNFKEIVRFSELTSSTGYSEEEFDKFFGSLRWAASQGFGEEEVDADKIAEAYKILGSKISRNMEKLGTKYAGNPKTERFVGAVWSGNLAHELIGLFEKA